MLACSVVLLGNSASLCSVLCERLTWYQLSSVSPATLSLTLTVKGSFVTSEPRLQEGGLPGCGQAYLCTSKGKRLWVTKKKKKKKKPGLTSILLSKCGGKCFLPFGCQPLSKLIPPRIVFLCLASVYSKLIHDLLLLKN